MITPPPLPATKKSAAHRCGTWSLLAPLLVLSLGALVHFFTNPAMPAMRAIFIILGLVTLILIISGFICAIFGLCGLRQPGASGLLGKSIVGLLLNGLFLAALFIAFLTGFKNSLASRQVTRSMQANARNYQEQVKDSYDAHRGITNIDVKRIDNLRSQFDQASRSLSGDDALIAQTMSQYIARMETAAKKYQAAANTLKNAKVLDVGSLPNIQQLAARRQIINKFLAANSELESVVTNSQNMVRADLIRQNVSSTRVDVTMTAFAASARPRNYLILQIRDCDDRMGRSMLVIVNLLESNWGHWRYDIPMQRIFFADMESLHIYQQAMANIDSASRRQIELQGQLVNLPAN